MTKMERIEFMQEFKVMMEETVDKTVNKAVDKAVNKAVDKAVNKAVDKAVNKAINRELKELKEVVIPNMQEDIRNISRSVAVIEVEHGKKLDILFEALGINSDNIEANKKRIEKCERKIEQNEAEIYYLKTHLSKV